MNKCESCGADYYHFCPCEAICAPMTNPNDAKAVEQVATDMHPDMKGPFLKAMPNPTEDTLNNCPLFEAIWQCVKGWDVNVPDYYVGYCGMTGSHVQMILDSIQSALAARDIENQRIGFEAARLSISFGNGLANIAVIPKHSTFADYQRSVEGGGK